MECEFCKKKYSNKSNLKYHQQSSKKCLTIQGKEIDNLECPSCSKVYINKKTLDVHLLKCNKWNKWNDAMFREKILELEKEVREKDKLLKQKDKDIKDIAIQSVLAPKTTTKTVIKTTTTTTTNNKYEFLAPFDLTSEYIRNKVNESFTEEYFLKGQRGVASFTYDNLIKDEKSGKKNYYCTDLSRKVFVYKKDDGKINKDYKSNSLTNMIAGDIISKSQCIYKDGLESIREDTSELFRKSMVYLNNLSDIESIKVNNEGFVRVLCGLVCNNTDNNEEEIVYVIEDSATDNDEEEEEDLSKYTNEYFERKEALIENEYRHSEMYNLFCRQLNDEKAKYKKN